MTEKRIPSGGRVPPLSTPVEVFEIGKPGQPTEIIVHNGKLYVYNDTGQTLIDGGIIQTQGVAVGLKSWVHDIVFTATDKDTASWAAGTIYFGDGSHTDIDSGNTGNIAATTYLYYDGTATLKKTTNATFVDDDHILLATIEEGATGAKCVITVSQLPSGTISAEQVVTGFLDADRIDAGTITAGKLNVTELSAIVANLGTITAGSMTGVTLSIGTGDNIFKATADGISLGDAVFGSAPFRVNMAGDLVASSVTLTNADVGSGSAWTGNKIANAYIGDLNADRITAGDIDTARIQTNVLSALQAEIANLSAINVDAGAITAGTITGVTVRTASGGARFQISGSKGSSYASSGAELTRLDGGGLSLAGSGGNIIRFYSSMDGTLYGQAGYDSSLGLYIASNNAKDTVIYGVKDAFLIANTGNAYVSSNSGSVYLASSVHSKSISLDYGQDEGDIWKIDNLYGHNGLQLYIAGQDDVIYFYSQAGGGNCSFWPYYGNAYVTGDKAFRIPHPDDPENKWIHYSSIEGPEVALKTRGISRLINGRVTIKLPHHWELVTDEYLTTVQLTPLENCNGLFALKDKLKHTRFEVQELQGGTSNTEFMWELTATRKGYTDFKPEQYIADDAEKVVGDIIKDEENPQRVQVKVNGNKNRKELYERLVREKYKSKTGKKYVSRTSSRQEEDLKVKEDFEKMEVIRKKCEKHKN